LEVYFFLLIKKMKKVDITQRKEPSESCDIPWAQRIDCIGPAGATQSICEAHPQCCFSIPEEDDEKWNTASKSLTPWCFKKAGVSECNIPYFDRVDYAKCGDGKCMDQNICESRGGCFEIPPEEKKWNTESNLWTPWCYEATIMDSCDIPVSHRMQCDPTSQNNCCDPNNNPYLKRENAAIQNLKFCDSSMNRSRNVLQNPPGLTDSRLDFTPIAYVACGGSGTCKDLVPRKELAVAPYTGNTEIKPPLSDETVKYGPGYTQYLKYLWDGSRNRAVYVAVPTSPNPQMPDDGWPMVFGFDFISAAGFSSDSPTQPGGILEQYIDGNFIKDGEYGYLSMMYLRQYMINSGFAVIMLSESEYDTEDMYECNLDNAAQAECWNEGNNPDAQVMRVFFDKIHDNTLLPGVKFNYERLAIYGYSVGANMCSRLINSFPFMETTPNQYSFPRIRGAVLIGGASYHCYQFDGEQDDIPANFKPCPTPYLGCCPTNAVEGNYDDGKLDFSNHPPVCLVHTVNDEWAPTYGAEYYFNVLSSVGVPVYRIVGEGKRHGLLNSEIPYIIAFLQTYLLPPLDKVDCAGANRCWADCGAKSGGKDDGGKDLVDGHCDYWLSGGGYCGDGPDYKQDGSVQCGTRYNGGIAANTKHTQRENKNDSVKSILLVVFIFSLVVALLIYLKKKRKF
jgi:hypothetical protein